MKSENYFENYGHRIGGMDHIELDKPNPVYMVGSCCTQLGWSYPSQMRSGKILIHIRIERIIVEIHFIIFKKRKINKQTTNKEKEKENKPILWLTQTQTTPNWLDCPRGVPCRNLTTS